MLLASFCVSICTDCFAKSSSESLFTYTDIQGHNLFDIIVFFCVKHMVVLNQVHAYFSSPLAMATAVADGALDNIRTVRAFAMEEKELR